MAIFFKMDTFPIQIAAKYLCFFIVLLTTRYFWTLGRINNHIIKKYIYFEKGPAIILKNNIIILHMYVNYFATVSVKC